jgi:hypothetical protein
MRESAATTYLHIAGRLAHRLWRGESRQDLKVFLDRQLRKLFQKLLEDEYIALAAVFMELVEDIAADKITKL